MTNFGKEVRKSLIDADMNQSLLAQRLGTSAGYISAILVGHKRVPPSFVASLESLGLLTVGIRVEYCLERGLMDIAGLSREQVIELVKQVDSLRAGQP